MTWCVPSEVRGVQFPARLCFLVTYISGKLRALLPVTPRGLSHDVESSWGGSAHLSKSVWLHPDLHLGSWIRRGVAVEKDTVRCHVSYESVPDLINLQLSRKGQTGSRDVVRKLTTPLGRSVGGRSFVRAPGKARVARTVGPTA